MNPGPHCYTIPAELPFTGILAQWLLEQYGKDAATLTKALILLPNRRACRSLREAFLSVTGGKPLLLPRIQPIGDMQEEGSISYLEAAAAIPPAISPARRELLLTRLVMAYQNKRYQPEQAAELARTLADFIDDTAREGVNFDALAKLVPEDLAAHWQHTLDFLQIVSQHWPRILESEGVIDPIDRRNRLLAATVAAWKKNPPNYPVIAAGSTGSMPATAKLLATIARLPQGKVILPALDRHMPKEEWELVSETHPQYGLKQLLERMECKRETVISLSSKEEESARVRCLRAILQPAEATAGWKQQPLPLQEGMKGIQMLTADTLLDEARMIAIALREVLETPKETAALITPDRQLARMVAAQMQRFGVTIDDSAGQALKDTPPGCFLRLVIDMVASRAAPASLLALLRHPFAAAGMESAECRRLSRQLEMALLRGVRREPGLEALSEAANNYTELAPLMNTLVERMRPLTDIFAQTKTVSLRALLSAHMQCAEWLASTLDVPGAKRLWVGEDGNSLAAFLAELLQHADVLDAVDPLSYPGLFDTLTGEAMVRPSYGLHPRLHILSPIEARLQRFDRVILGGLNEGTWPAHPGADPWMSRPMRAAFGLIAPERQIGQSAHDITMLAAAPEVLLTRARKVEGTPTVPSRWLVRLETLLKGMDESAWQQLQASAHYEQGKKLLDVPLTLPPLERPAPVPPLAARPRKLRVTAIDNWLRDPYVIYAKYILRLDRFPPLDEEPDAADFGMVVHQALERFIKAWPDALPNHAREKLLECGLAAFSAFMDRPAIGCLWWPRFEAMAGWIIEREKERRRAGLAVASEIEGKWLFAVDGKDFTLTTRIDRMEMGHGLTLIDYKTGAVPTQSEIEAGLANQLPLEALIALHGTLSIPQGKKIIAALEYWRLSGNVEDCEIRQVEPSFIAAAQERLEGLIRRFDNPATPYAAQNNPSLIPRYNDYAHLTRRQEWEAV